MKIRIVEDAERLVIHADYEAERDRVWQAWTRSEGLRAWFGVPEGEVISTLVEPRPGGAWNAVIQSEGRTYELIGRWVEIDSPHHGTVMYQWRGDEALGLGITRLRIRLGLLRKGGTRIILVHDRFPDPAWALQHVRPWTSNLERLGRWLEQQPVPAS